MVVAGVENRATYMMIGVWSGVIAIYLSVSNDSSVIAILGGVGDGAQQDGTKWAIE